MASKQNKEKAQGEVAESNSRRNLSSSITLPWELSEHEFVLGLSQLSVQDVITRMETKEYSRMAQISQDEIFATSAGSADSPAATAAGGSSGSGLGAAAGAAAAAAAAAAATAPGSTEQFGAKPRSGSPAGVSQASSLMKPPFAFTTSTSQSMDTDTIGGLPQRFVQMRQIWLQQQLEQQERRMSRGSWSRGAAGAAAASAGGADGTDRWKSVMLPGEVCMLAEQKQQQPEEQEESTDLPVIAMPFGPVVCDSKIDVISKIHSRQMDTGNTKESGGYMQISPEEWWSTSSRVPFQDLLGSTSAMVDVDPGGSSGLTDGSGGGGGGGGSGCDDDQVGEHAPSSTSDNQQLDASTIDQGTHSTRINTNEHAMHIQELIGKVVKGRLGTERSVWGVYDIEEARRERLKVYGMLGGVVQWLDDQPCLPFSWKAGDPIGELDKLRVLVETCLVDGSNRDLSYRERHDALGGCFIAMWFKSYLSLPQSTKDFAEETIVSLIQEAVEANISKPSPANAAALDESFDLYFPSLLTLLIQPFCLISEGLVPRLVSQLVQIASFHPIHPIIVKWVLMALCKMAKWTPSSMRQSVTVRQWYPIVVDLFINSLRSALQECSGTSANHRKPSASAEDSQLIDDAKVDADDLQVALRCARLLVAVGPDVQTDLPESKLSDLDKLTIPLIECLGFEFYRGVSGANSKKATPNSSKDRGVVRCKSNMNNRRAIMPVDPVCRFLSAVICVWGEDVSRGRLMQDFRASTRRNVLSAFAECVLWSRAGGGTSNKAAPERDGLQQHCGVGNMTNIMRIWQVFCHAQAASGRKDAWEKALPILMAIPFRALKAAVLSIKDDPSARAMRDARAAIVALCHICTLSIRLRSKAFFRRFWKLGQNGITAIITSVCSLEPPSFRKSQEFDFMMMQRRLLRMWAFALVAKLLDANAPWQWSMQQLESLAHSSVTQLYSHTRYLEESAWAAEILRVFCPLLLSAANRALHLDNSDGTSCSAACRMDQMLMNMIVAVSETGGLVQDSNGSVRSGHLIRMQTAIISSTLEWWSSAFKSTESMQFALKKLTRCISVVANNAQQFGNVRAPNARVAVMTAHVLMEQARQLPSTMLRLAQVNTAQIATSEIFSDEQASECLLGALGDLFDACSSLWRASNPASSNSVCPMGLLRQPCASAWMQTFIFPLAFLRFADEVQSMMTSLLCSGSSAWKRWKNFFALTISGFDSLKKGPAMLPAGFSAQSMYFDICSRDRPISAAHIWIVATLLKRDICRKSLLDRAALQAAGRILSVAMESDILIQNMGHEMVSLFSLSEWEQQMRHGNGLEWMNACAAGMCSALRAKEKFDGIKPIVLLERLESMVRTQISCFHNIEEPLGASVLYSDEASDMSQPMGDAANESEQLSSRLVEPSSFSRLLLAGIQSDWQTSSLFVRFWKHAFDESVAALSAQDHIHLLQVLPDLTNALRQAGVSLRRKQTKKRLRSPLVKIPCQSEVVIAGDAGQGTGNTASDVNASGQDVHSAGNGFLSTVSSPVASALKRTARAASASSEKANNARSEVLEQRRPLIDPLELAQANSQEFVKISGTVQRDECEIAADDKRTKKQNHQKVCRDAVLTEFFSQPSVVSGVPSTQSSVAQTEQVNGASDSVVDAVQETQTGAVNLVDSVQPAAAAAAAASTDTLSNTANHGSNDGGTPAVTAQVSTNRVATEMPLNQLDKNTESNVNAISHEEAEEMSQQSRHVGFNLSQIDIISASSFAGSVCEDDTAKSHVRSKKRQKFTPPSADAVNTQSILKRSAISSGALSFSPPRVESIACSLGRGFLESSSEKITAAIRRLGVHFPRSLNMVILAMPDVKSVGQLASQPVTTFGKDVDHVKDFLRQVALRWVEKAGDQPKVGAGEKESISHRLLPAMDASSKSSRHKKRTFAESVSPKTTSRAASDAAASISENQSPPVPKFGQGGGGGDVSESNGRKFRDQNASHSSIDVDHPDEEQLSSHKMFEASPKRFRSTPPDALPSLPLERSASPVLVNELRNESRSPEMSDEKIPRNDDQLSLILQYLESDELTQDLVDPECAEKLISMASSILKQAAQTSPQAAQQVMKRAIQIAAFAQSQEES